MIGADRRVYGDERLAWGAPIALIVAVCLIVLSFSSNDLLAQTSENRDPRRTVSTRNATYTIGWRDENGHRACIYRNGVNLHCKNEQAFFEKPIRTRNYEIIPLVEHQAGSGNRWWNYSLIIENGRRSVIKYVAEWCFSASCNIKATKVNFRANTVHFDIGRSKGHRISAHFQNGQLSVRQSKLDPKEPLSKRVCHGLLDQLRECSTGHFHSAALFPASERVCPEGISNSSNFFFHGVENDYRGFSRKTFDEACKNACTSGQQFERKNYLKQICRW